MSSKWRLLCVLVAVAVVCSQARRASRRTKPRQESGFLTPTCNNNPRPPSRIFKNHSVMFEAPEGWDPFKKESRRIKNGLPVESLGFPIPSFVSIRSKSLFGWTDTYCGGVLVNKDMIYTLGNCLVGHDIEFAFTHYHPRKWSEKHVKPYKAMKYCRSVKNKELFGYIALSADEVKKILSPGDAEIVCSYGKKDLLGTEIIAVGHGITDDGWLGDTYSDTIQSLELKEKPCDEIDPMFMCAVPADTLSGSDFCLGDEGSPVYGWEDDDQVLLGIVGSDNGCVANSEHRIIDIRYMLQFSANLDLCTECTAESCIDFPKRH